MGVLEETTKLVHELGAASPSAGILILSVLVVVLVGGSVFQLGVDLHRSLDELSRCIKGQTMLLSQCMESRAKQAYFREIVGQ